MLFLRNLLFLLIPVSILVGFSLARIANPFRLASVFLVVVVALPSLWAGPETFMPRQDFRGVANILQTERVEKTFVYPAWDLPGVRRYLPRSAHAEVHGFQQLDELRESPHDVSRLAVVLTRPTRDQLSLEALSEALKSRFVLINESLLKGHRGGVKVYRFNQIDGKAVP
jgi:hypothetical protein